MKYEKFLMPERWSTAEKGAVYGGIPRSIIGAKGLCLRSSSENVQANHAKDDFCMSRMQYQCGRHQQHKPKMQSMAPAAPSSASSSAPAQETDAGENHHKSLQKCPNMS